MTLYTESVADQTDHFADVFVREDVAYGCDDVIKFESTKPTPFCLEKYSQFRFIALTLAGPSEDV